MNSAKLKNIIINFLYIPIIIIFFSQFFHFENVEFHNSLTKELNANKITREQKEIEEKERQRTEELRKLEEEMYRFVQPTYKHPRLDTTKMKK